MKPDGVVVELLSRDRLESHLPALVRLDTQMVAQMGSVYSEQPWTEREFRMDIVGKWELSRAALLGSGSLIGFWIASERVAGVCHTHRVAVDPEHGRRGVASHLFAEILRHLRTVRTATRELTLEVGYENQAALSFYRRHGFVPLTGGEIVHYLRARSRIAEVPGDHLVEADGSRFRVLHRAV